MNKKKTFPRESGGPHLSLSSGNALIEALIILPVIITTLYFAETSMKGMAYRIRNRNLARYQSTYYLRNKTFPDIFMLRQKFGLTPDTELKPLAPDSTELSVGTQHKKLTIKNHFYLYY